MLLSQPQLAREQLRIASAQAPDNVLLQRQLGIAEQACGDLPAAREALAAALALAPDQPLNHLHLGQVLEQQGQRRQAAQHYYRALLRSQAQGQWMDEASTPPPLRRAVLRAMDCVDQERGGLLDALLDGFRQQHGVAALARVQRCLDGHLKRVPARSPDPRQRPRFLYFQDLPPLPFYPNQRFDWVAALQARTNALRAEAEAALGGDEVLPPFLGELAEDQRPQFLAGADPAWQALFFYRDGQRIEASHTRCPHTSATLESLPLVRIRQHAPEICFSVLAADTHILPHTGVTNTRLVVHLPLIVPPQCALRVADQTHAWREGEVVVFDDSFEHEAWNRSDRPRVILLMDTWHPDLSAVEREALAALIGEIGDFNRL